FFLELAALLLLALAAAEPHLPRPESGRPLVVVLDDSYSMRAGGADSPRAQAQRALEEELGRGPRRSGRLLLAGERPPALGGPARSVAEAREQLAGWTCRAPSARLDDTLALAAEVGGERAALLVLTDQPQPEPPEQGRLRWWAFGRPRPNAAFVTAARSA